MIPSIGKAMAGNARPNMLAGDDPGSGVAYHRVPGRANAAGGISFPSCQTWFGVAVAARQSIQK